VVHDVPQVETQLRGGITIIVHFLGAKELDNSKGWGVLCILKQKEENRDE